MKIDLAEIEPACGHERPADLSTTELAAMDEAERQEAGARIDTQYKSQMCKDLEKYAGEIDSLRRDLEEAKDYIEFLDVQNHRLRCDADTDRLNAERYRWLRGDLCEDHSHRWTQWEVRCWKAPMWTDDLRLDDLDAAIDLARARGEG